MIQFLRILTESMLIYGISIMIGEAVIPRSENRKLNFLFVNAIFLAVATTLGIW